MDNPKSNAEMSEAVPCEQTKPVCTLGESCDKVHPTHFKYLAHPTLEELVKKYRFSSQMTEEDRAKFTVREGVLNRQFDLLQQSNPLPKAIRIKILAPIKGDIKRKLEVTAPYNFFLNAVNLEGDTTRDDMSIRFSELLDPALGDLESSLHANCTVNFGWLMDHYEKMGHGEKPMTLLYYTSNIEKTGDLRCVTPVQVQTPNGFGTHHTKLMILAYKDGSIRVVVMTANLTALEWEMATQGIWISPLCPPGEKEDNETNFKRDFLNYLRAYDLNELQPWVEKVENANFKDVKVFFVGSVPGYHTVDTDGRPLWGQAALRSVLRQHLPEGDPRQKESLIIQCSSIGCLGPKPQAWLLPDIVGSMCPNRPEPTIHFIFPTHDNVIEGIPAKGLILNSTENHLKQLWVENYLCKWKSDRRNRTRALPHIKSYCIVSEELDKMTYFVLTSANMSKSAWGKKLGSQIRISSFEAGVVFIPQFMIGADYFPLKPSSGIAAPVFPLPYDLPVTRYTWRDKVWLDDYEDYL